jgi:NuA3 HAT complex component NTO1
MRHKLDARSYVSVVSFVVEMANMFRDTVGLDASDATSKLTADQKDMRLRAKRIIGKIKPLLQDAARNEAELERKGDLQEDSQTVATIFDDCFRTQVASAHPSGGDQDEPENDADEKTESIRQLTNGHSREDSGKKGDVKRAAEDMEMADAPDTKKRRSPRTEESTATNAATARHNVTDTAIIRLEVGPGQTIPISNIDGRDGSAPALSNSGSTNPSTTHADPLTPPRSEKDIPATLARGGVAWYLSEFEPHGTTIHDEQWKGREIIRGMSEELSELDDDALNGLVDHEMQDVTPTESVSRATLEVAAAQKQRVRPKRKRW